MRTCVIAVAVVLCGVLNGSSLIGQPYGRTFVSAQVGSDANNCLPTTPCRTLARALLYTVANGEIIVLDSGGYGSSLLIDKAVQIQAPLGVYAGMTTASGNTITVAAGASSSVLLEGLTLNSTGGSTGVSVDSAGSLHLDRCKITGFASTGIAFDVTGRLFVQDSIFRRNSFAGISMDIAAGLIVASIDGSTFEKNGYGVNVVRNARATIRDSLALRNLRGYSCTFPGALDPISELTIENSIAAHNSDFGIRADYGAVVRVSNSSVTNNGIGFLNYGGFGSFFSRGNNTVEGNTTNTSGPIGSLTPR